MKSNCSSRIENVYWNKTIPSHFEYYRQAAKMSTNEVLCFKQFIVELIGLHGLYWTIFRLDQTIYRNGELFPWKLCKLRLKIKPGQLLLKLHL